MLVTGGAGFIGSNFVRWWARERPSDTVVAYDALTYAGNRESLDGVPHEFVHGDIGDLDFAEKTLRDYEIDTIVNFAAESHNSYAITNPGRVLPHQRGRYADVVRGRAPHRRREASTASTTSPRARSTATSRSTRRSRSTSRRRTRRARRTTRRRPAATTRCAAYYETFDLPISITNCANNYGPYQFPEKVIPLFTTRALNDQDIPLYAVDARTGGSGSTPTTTAVRSHASSTTAASARRTTSAPARNAASRRSPTACSPRSGSRRH